MFAGRCYVALLVVGVYLTCAIQAVRHFYLDRPDHCSGEVTTIDSTSEDIIVQPFDQVAVANPPTPCRLILQSGFQEQYYRFQIQLAQADLGGCSLTVRIYNGGQAGGQPIKTLSCPTPQLSTFYSTTGAITLILYRTGSGGRDHFTLKINLYRDPNAPPEFFGTSKLPTAAIVGIAVGILLIIAAAILIGWCYKKGKLPGLQKDYGTGSVYKASLNNLEERGRDNPSQPEDDIDKMSVTTATTASRSNFDLTDPRIWNSLTANGTHKEKTANIGSMKYDPPGGRPYAKKGDLRSLAVAPPKVPNSRERNGLQTFASEPSIARSNLNKNENFDRGDTNRGSGSPGRIRGRRETGSPGTNRRSYAEATDRGHGLDMERNEGLRGSKQRSASEGETLGTRKRDKTGLFENPDAEGYLYDYDQVKQLSSEGPNKLKNDFHTELKNAVRSNSLKKTNKADQSGGNEAPGAPGTVKQSGRGGKQGKGEIPELGNIDFSDPGNSRHLSTGELSDPSDVDRMSNPALTSSNPAIPMSIKQAIPIEEDSPGTKKRRKKSPERKKSKCPERKFLGAKDRQKPGQGRSAEGEIPSSDPNTSFSSTDIPTGTPNKKSKPSKQKAKPLPDDAMPPEAFAPIFNTDPSTMQHYYPNQPGYQGAFDPRYPMGVNPYQPAAGPYQQAGQAAWYVEGTPGGPQKMAFAMTTHTASESDPSLQGHPHHHHHPVQYGAQPGYPGNYPEGGYGDVTHPGMPDYSSTPYYPQNQYGAPQGHHKHHHKSRNKSSPYYPDTTGALVPAGTVLDDPRIPPPGTSLVRYDENPQTGVKTSQVVWTDANPDPTDPPPGGPGPQITRKTITRVTTRATEDELPNAPNPILHELTFRTAEQMQQQGVTEPAFMSPSKGPPSRQGYAPPSIMYAAETPERDNAPYFTTPVGSRHHPGAPAPEVVHSAPKQSQAFRDRITLSTADQ